MLNWFMKFFKKKKPEEPAASKEEAQKSKEQAACGMEEFAKLFDNDDTFI